MNITNTLFRNGDFEKSEKGFMLAFLGYSPILIMWENFNEFKQFLE